MNSAPALDAAIDYASRRWPVFPVNEAKRPLTPHGLNDATEDESQIRAWWATHPRALVAIATGERSGIVAVDVDVTPELSGFDSLEDLGVVTHPNTITAHTPRGGFHLLFRWPGHHVKTIAGKLGPGLDIRGDGGSLILPPGPRRYWDPLLGPSSEIAKFPEWARIKEPMTRAAVVRRPAPSTRLTRYGEVALDNAVKRITTAVAGAQEATLNKESYAVGQLVGSGAIPAGLALDSLTWAARRMPSFDSRRPWRMVDLERKVNTAFTDGLRKPRSPDHAGR